MKRLASLFVLFSLILIFSGCGGSGGSDSDYFGSDTSTGGDPIVNPDPDPGPDPVLPIVPPDPTAKPPALVTVNSALPTGGELSQGGETTIQALVTDSDGNNVPDNTVVTFTASLGNITSSAPTKGGIATANFQAGNAGGTVTITATAGTVSGTTTIIVKAGAAASIIKDSVTPATIGIFGSGIEDTSQIKFNVRDAVGNPAIDGTVVNFTLNTTVGGGEKLSAASAKTAGGSVLVALQSGSVPGTVKIIASITSGTSVISTEAGVTIVSNRPDAGRITLGAEILNLAGGVTLGLQSKINAYLGDRAGNVVPDGTPVSFITECGTIGESSGFQTSTTFGVASATFQTSAPTVPYLNGIAPAGNVGSCRIVAYTPGKGTFVDNNGNGIFDGTDTCSTQLDEPYIDANDSLVWESGEYYVDVNQNGQFDKSIVNCLDNSMIWTSMNLLISDYAKPLSLYPPSFNLAIGEGRTFTVNFSDMYDNALVAGTKFTVTADGGKLSGVTDYVQADTTGLGDTLYFSLFADTNEDAEPKPVTITATITPPSGAPQGNNGATIFEVATGMINIPTGTSGASLYLSDSLVSGAALAQGQSTTITAIARDDDGILVPDNTTVTFSASVGTISAPTKTVGGVATATYTALLQGGGVTITAISPFTTGNHYLTVANGAAATILLESVNPEQIGVRGSGLSDTSTLHFAVNDANGLPVPDGTTVSFALKTPLGGGERLSALTAVTVGGKVSNILQSGTRSGTAAITASITTGTGTIISTVARVVIAAGLPDQKHFSLSATPVNLPGYTYFGETTQIRAYLADRYSNPVPLDTPIFFESEAGAMALTQVMTNNLGQAIATHITQLPYPSTISSITALPGLSKILAWTAGQESFVDNNGNGIYDSGEPFGDIGEPFIDADDDGIYDAALTVYEEERYVDLNGNNQYDGPDGQWDAETFIWTTHNILWSYATASDINLSVTPAANCPNFAIPGAQGCDCTIKVTDKNGSPIVGGSKLTVHTSVSSGEFTISPNEFNIPDETRPGPDTTLFTFGITNSGIGGDPVPYPLTITLDVPAVGGAAAFSKSKTITFVLQP